MTEHNRDLDPDTHLVVIETVNHAVREVYEKYLAPTTDAQRREALWKRPVLAWPYEVMDALGGASKTAIYEASYDPDFPPITPIASRKVVSTASLLQYLRNKETASRSIHASA